MNVVNVSLEFGSRLAGSQEGEEFRKKFLSSLDNEDAWESDDEAITFNFTDVDKISPSFATYAFGYFTKYATVEKVADRIKFESINRVHRMIIEEEIKSARSKIGMSSEAAAKYLNSLPPRIVSSQKCKLCGTDFVHKTPRPRLCETCVSYSEGFNQALDEISNIYSNPNAEMIISYLESEGWEHFEEGSDDIFSSYIFPEDDGRIIEVVNIPKHSGYSDYARCCSNAIKNIAEIYCVRYEDIVVKMAKMKIDEYEGE